jgi:WD40 repeat protein
MQIIQRIFLSRWNLKMLFFLFPLLSVQPAFSNENMETDLFVISPGNEVILYQLKDGKIRGLNSLLPDDKWSNAYWPCYDKGNKIIYFEAENKDFKISRQIFYIDLDDKTENPRKVVVGRRPSISPNGHLLAFYRHPNELWVLEINSQKKMRIVCDISDYQPTVWISEKSLLYADKNNHLMKLDVISKKTEYTSYDYVIPAALSPDGSQVLCGSYDGKKIFLYTIKTNKIKILKKTNIISMGSSFVWRNDGQSFFYTRQTFGNIMKFNEIRSLFLYSLDGKEQKLIDRYSLFGGVQLN